MKDQKPLHQLGRHTYGKGMHHLDGDAVLGYLRIRNGADGLDSSRTARQRRMMVAIFKKLKNEGKLSQIPALISAANSGIYTNTTLSQTTALANYATKLDADNIQTLLINLSRTDRDSDATLCVHEKIGEALSFLLEE